MPPPALELCALARTASRVVLWPADPRSGVLTGTCAGLDEFFNVVLRDATLEVPGFEPSTLPLVLVRADTIAMIHPIPPGESPIHSE
ncbi:SnRNP Sm related protein [Giardia duodenalis]|uniref:SnRNP Sm-like protein n=2 Tax=Giardia intestinalis TaxID=5741 RepID=C6LT37_GIAIB|nr:SnRNP Sm-like protein [Giardia intestinalis ATCC 50581]ESU39875.1 SnRNP Sm related protein [Giardia intestinalis]